MEDLFIYFICFLIMIIGIIGAIVPIVPGPIITYLGLLGVHFFTDLDFSSSELLYYGILTILIFFSDYILQFIGVKKMGGQKNALYGTGAGILIGLFLAPIGLIIGPFLGAFFGSLIDNKDNVKAFRVAFAALLGFFFGTLIKLVYSIYIIYIVFVKLLNLY